MISSLAIIGTAGRYQDGTELAKTPKMYWETMLRAAYKIIDKTGAEILVSGGAAYADHIAVEIFLANPSRFKLQLHLPSRLDSDGYDGLCFVSRRDKDEASITNYYHRRFTKALQEFKGKTWSSFLDLKTATSHPHCSVNIESGFKARNLKVATADHCVAMTFGNGKTLKEGGTAHTMGAFLARQKHGDSYHLDLNTLKLWKGANVS